MYQKCIKSVSGNYLAGKESMATTHGNENYGFQGYGKAEALIDDGFDGYDG
ncbi:MAG: hypothetical protein F6K40_12185 [Okeania sp. SIO3I5]|uniref:hypothetical protein n=1 Tax=Okeania sp. SIO3I5 TaxID=2607805 RepID=UPI0013B88DF7|nr:hypothetical protein [Okeania sp. SIO3I5]NEQ36988.1 hypothetical protein [Okeania sp. SIO3I5]